MAIVRRLVQFNVDIPYLVQDIRCIWLLPMILSFRTNSESRPPPTYSLKLTVWLQDMWQCRFCDAQQNRHTKSTGESANISNNKKTTKTRKSKNGAKNKKVLWFVGFFVFCFFVAHGKRSRSTSFSVWKLLPFAGNAGSCTGAGAWPLGLQCLCRIEWLFCFPGQAKCMFSFVFCLLKRCPVQWCWKLL